MKRLALFFFFDEDGCVDEYISYMLSDLKKNVDKILVVINGDINDAGKAIFHSLADEVLFRENIGYDVWAYKTGIDHIGYETLKQYDEFIMMNYTNFGPIFPFQEMFSKMMEKDSLDFWGLSMSWGNQTDIPEHIQSHFVVVRNSILQSPYFQEYWDKIPAINCYEDALYKHEFVFTKFFAKKGFKWDVYLNIEEYREEIANPLLAYPYLMLKEKRTPLIKRKSFFLNADWLFGIGLKSNIRETLQFIEEKTDYNVGLIWKNLLRTQSMRTIQWNMGTDYVISDRFMTPTTFRAVVIFDLKHVENWKKYKKYLDTLPQDTDIYFRMGKRYPKESLGEITSYYNREIRAISVDDCISNQNYSFAILINDRKEKSALTDAFNVYSKEDFDNLLSSTSALCQLGDYIQTKKELGGLFSDISCDRRKIDAVWKKNYKKIVRLLESEKIHIKLEKELPPIYLQSGVCAIKADFLGEYFEVNRMMQDNHIDDLLKWIVLALIMQSRGYACGHFYNERYITDVLSYNEYYQYYRFRESSKTSEQSIYELKHFNLREMILLNLKYCNEKRETISKWIKKR